MSLSSSSGLSVKAIDRSEQCNPASAHFSPQPVPRSSAGSRSTELVHRATGTVLPGSPRHGDTSVVARRLTSEHFVGRRTELEELEQALDGAAQRQPAVVLLGGDSGVGKTRLLGELERRLSERDVLALRGETVEQDDGELPYAPLTSALRPLVRSDDPALGELGSGSRAQLSLLLPGLENEGGPEPRHDPSAQLRLFESLVELLDLLSERQPLALILEDMHWADRSTRTFVAFLARSLRQERVVLVLIYRADEIHLRHPLAPQLNQLERLHH